jgi:ESF2/ABP1 family protein
MKHWKSTIQLSKSGIMASIEGSKPSFKTGLIYLGRIPPHMKSHKLRYILKQYGPLKRMYLRKEPLWRYKKRLEKGGRKGRLFVDGWAEFEKKIDAKECENQLNAKVTGLRGRWANDIWNIRYLHGFKWVHLEEALEKERREHLDRFKEENEKARETARKWLKQTKTTVAAGKRARQPHLDEEEDSVDDSEDIGKDDELTHE